MSREKIADDGTFGSIHNESYITFDTTYLDICFIDCEYITDVVIIVIDKGFNTSKNTFC